MDSLLVLILVFVGSCVLVFLLMAGVSWTLNLIMNKYHIGRSRSNTVHGASESTNHSNQIPRPPIPILEAQVQRPKNHSDIESTCLVIFPGDVDGQRQGDSIKVNTDYAIAMKSDTAMSEKAPLPRPKGPQ